MDTRSKNVLDELLQRLDKMDAQQQKLDRVMERLDTLQNIIERQHQKQNLLDQRLVEMTIKSEQEKAVTTDQLQRTLLESADPFSVIDGQGESSLFPHKTTQQLQGWSNQLNDKLKSLEDRTVDTAHKYHQLTSWSHKVEDKMTELADNNRDTMKTFLVEIRSVKDLIKGQTNSELIWLNNEIDKKLSDIGSLVREMHQQQIQAKEEIVCSMDQVVKTVVQHNKQQEIANESLSGKQNLSTKIWDKQMQNMLDLEKQIEQLNSTVLSMPREMKASVDTILMANKQIIIDLKNANSNSVAEMNENSKEQSRSVHQIVKSDLNKLFEAVRSELQTNTKVVIAESEKQTHRIISAAECAKEDLKRLFLTEGDNTSKCKVELGNIHSAINSLSISISGNTATVVKKLDSTKASMVSRHTTMNKHFEELATDLKGYIYKTKREIFAVTEKEAQIVRDQIQRPLSYQGTYTFDFYVNNFKTLVRSGNLVHSPPWHINEMQTCVTGSARMMTDGEMKVWLLYGRHPLEVGLQPRPVKTLKIKATVRDIHENKLPPLEIGENSFPFSESNITWNGSWGYLVGATSCDELLQKGYGEQEGYDEGALLIRFEVTV